MSILAGAIIILLLCIFCLKSLIRSLSICQVIQPSTNLLLANPKNIVFLHCNAGKGRTGTGISSALLFCGMIHNAQDALKYYSHKRFINGCGGVTQPGQLRYVKYFEQVLKGEIKSAPSKVLKQIVLNFLPTHQAEMRPYIEIFQYTFDNLVISYFKTHRFILQRQLMHLR